MGNRILESDVYRLVSDLSAETYAAQYVESSFETGFPAVLFRKLHFLLQTALRHPEKTPSEECVRDYPGAVSACQL